VFEFDPDRVAALEARGWRAYYDRDWGKLLALLVAVCQEQFHIPFPLSLVGAYHTSRASMAWVPENNDRAVVLKHLTRFYRLARRHSGLRFDPARAAALELSYWAEHRRLVYDPDKGPVVDAMTALHCELFALPPERLRESAKWRVAASDTVDAITGGYSLDPEADWANLEDELRRCYRSVYRELKGRAREACGSAGAAYAFVTTWRIQAPIERVWTALNRPEEWPRWWPGLEHVALVQAGDERGIGAAREYVFKSVLPYRLRFIVRSTRIEQPRLIEGDASGELVGMGRWTLAEEVGATRVRYEWNVSTTRAWMNAVARIGRPVLAWNHDVLMRGAGEGLQRYLDDRMTG
jgi:uncharacterized protein YndB with AHSA1/START domain